MAFIKVSTTDELVADVKIRLARILPDAGFEVKASTKAGRAFVTAENHYADLPGAARQGLWILQNRDQLAAVKDYTGKAEKGWDI